MHIEVITLFPDAFKAMSSLGVTGRAIEDGKIDVRVKNPRDFALDRHRSVDDRPYGGGPGMVMTVEPLRSTIGAAKAESSDQCKVSLLSPQGRKLDQDAIKELAARPGLILVCGRYEGLDERLIELEVDEEWSIGDYVISGGELAAAVLIDAVARLIPGVLGDVESALQDSFMDGILDHPHFSRPESIEDLAVPPVLLSGDHEAIRQWRRKQALGRTWLRRPELLDKAELDEEARVLLSEFKREMELESENTGD
jgi:tRNA (guanine37-N1)-methyltransferase